ncbi:MAG: Asp23/Gls24 family envelope stress response protein [Peptostreptococcaceae bacterium]|nr:Asp23/Gls24 family envelope stress response protein [Peptostreptococcaceae bacterium]
MKVYALVGKSGSGKSYQAMNICRELNIESIIDDGLLVYGNTVAAGTSAKRQATKIGAIRTALFTNNEHRLLVSEKIKELNIETILILGTSDGMVERIADRLDLPAIEKTVYIEDITTEGERSVAHKQRHELGKHVIPVPTLQIKREFSGYFLDPLKIFRRWGNKEVFSEKSVVRPTYSYLGDYTISDKAIYDIVHYIGLHTEGVCSIIRADASTTHTGVEITALVILNYGCRIIDTAKNLQSNILSGVQMMTAFNIETVNVEVRGLK